MIRAPVLSSALALWGLLNLSPLVWSRDSQESSTIIVVRPAAEPIPALKYRFLPERSSLVPGNAALFYHRAIELLDEARQNARPHKEPGKLLAIEELASGAWVRTGPLRID